MLFLYKNYQIILIIIEFIFLFQISQIYSEDIRLNNTISNFINIEGKLILIFEDDLNIYDLNNYKAIGEYNESIQSQKDITYIKDGIFIISGLNNKRQFIFQSFVLLNENLTKNSAFNEITLPLHTLLTDEQAQFVAENLVEFCR